VQLKEYERARKAYEDGLSRFPQGTHLLMGYAHLHVLMRENPDAIKLLERMLQVDPEMMDLVASAPEFERLRNDPDFRKLIGKS
jgi:gamma-glutamyl:cysteine ligase YbdK (ATP-grasp superfamily)